MQKATHDFQPGINETEFRKIKSSVEISEHKIIFSNLCE